MEPSSPLTFELVKQDIMRRHLEQLQGLTLITLPLEGKPRAGYSDLVKWTEDSQTQINAGIANRVFGGPMGSSINFNNAFMAFLESAAMYLRDTSLVVRAVETFRSGDSTGALKMLEQSTSQIDTLADMWGMKFVMICDLVQKHPDGHAYLVGPFCGAFVPKDFSKPFIGVAFKGTSVTQEIINDLIGAVTTRVPDYLLFGAQISQGFYYPMFSTYGGKPSSEPYALIKKAIQDISSTGSSSAVTHVTGHSLGAAYGSLCYAQLTIEGTGTTKASVGDLYTFGSPRVGRGDFAKPFKTAVAPPLGSAWRIANHRDYVPKIPASPFWPISRDPFIHIDALYKIYTDQKPVAGSTEIGTSPAWAIPTAITPHYTDEYYKSLTYATTGKPPKRDSAAEHLDSLAAVDALGGLEYFQAAALRPADAHLLGSVKPQDFATTSTCTVSLETFEMCTRGTVQLGPLIGEIIAWGNTAGIVTDRVSLHYKSLKDVYAQDAQVALRSSGTHPKEVQVIFVVDGAAVAVAVITTRTEVGGLHVDGTCTWEFNDTAPVDQVSEEWPKAADTVFEKLFVIQ